MTVTNMTETPKRPARTPAQRRADLRARAATMLMDNNESALLQAADAVVIEALLHSYRRKLPHDFAALSAELLRRLQAARVTVTPIPEPIEVKVEPTPEPEAVTVTKPEPTPEPTPAPVTVTRGYPIEVQRLAVQMADADAPSRDIRAAIMERLGRAPSVSNVAKLVSRWRAALAGVGDPIEATPRAETAPPVPAPDDSVVLTKPAPGPADADLHDILAKMRAEQAAERAAEREKQQEAETEPSPEHITRIVRLHLSGMRKRSIARLVGCSVGDINNILKRG